MGESADFQYVKNPVQRYFTGIYLYVLAGYSSASVEYTGTKALPLDTPPIAPSNRPRIVRSELSSSNNL